jgi:glycosyltransferase involved in cell wall biosynthesis
MEEQVTTRTDTDLELAADAASSGPPIPLVDVGIPTLGSPGSLPLVIEAVESVFAQTLPDWRLVISENGEGSDEVSRALAPYVADPRVNHVVTGTRVGRGENWTNLIRSGSAPYVAVLHDDDRWEPGFLERRVAFLDANPECGFVFSDYVVIDGEGSRIARSRLSLYEGVQKSSVLFPALYERMVVAAPTVLVRRTAYEAVGSRYKEIIFSDHEMWIRLSAFFDAGFLPVHDAEYRFHEEQTSSSRLGKAAESLAVLEAADDLPAPPALRRRMLAEALTWTSLDAIEAGSRNEGYMYLKRAAETGGLSLARPGLAMRMGVAGAALVTGRAGRATVAWLRERRWQNRRRRGVSFADEIEQGDPSTWE